jgi:hypothetical protein
MRIWVLSIVISLFVITSCAHNIPNIDRIEGRSMYYEYPKETVMEASITVLTERDWSITEINSIEDYIKAKTKSKLPGIKVRIELHYRSEGTGTWMEIKKHVPYQVLPTVSSRYKFDISDLFHQINIELDRNY